MKQQYTAPKAILACLIPERDLADKTGIDFDDMLKDENDGISQANAVDLPEIG